MRNDDGDDDVDMENEIDTKENLLHYFCIFFYYSFLHRDTNFDCLRVCNKKGKFSDFNLT